MAAVKLRFMFSISWTYTGAGLSEHFSLHASTQTAQLFCPGGPWTHRRRRRD